MITKIFNIGGMTCIHCQHRIEKALSALSGVARVKVSYAKGTAKVTFDPSALSESDMAAAVEENDYRWLGEAVPAAKQTARFAASGDMNHKQVAGLVVIILALYILVQQFAVVLTGAFPTAQAGMGYGALFLIGLLTSVHCLGMCGGINLSQCISPTEQSLIRESRKAAMVPSFLYNSGRVVSYTIIGGAIGGIGSAVSLTGRIQAVVHLIAGVFMVIMGVNMLGIFPALRRFNVHMPAIFADKIDAAKAANRGPFIIGLLNGFMPCGPLQAMQLYALSTGSPLKGALSLFVFSVGTVPLMFLLGAASSLLSKRFTRAVMRVGAVVITVLGLSMFTYGWNLGGFPSPMDQIAYAMGYERRGSAEAASGGAAFKPNIVDGKQIVNSTLTGYGYPAIVVQQGVPVEWHINAGQGSITGCNDRMVIREYGIQHRFNTGDNVISFTPDKTGRFTYSCWMGMIRSTITVVPEGAIVAKGADADSDASQKGDEPKLTPAGVKIPTEEVAVGKVRALSPEEQEKIGARGLSQIQLVTISLTDKGFSPALVVMQRDVPTFWQINNRKTGKAETQLIFPAFYSKPEAKAGQNGLQLRPTTDFDFSTGDNKYYGLVETVDDIAKVDMNEVKSKAAAWETQIYPDEYFKKGPPPQGCCGG
jgi:sulfite exporter TauE/SafE/copper chaperone CopZ